MRVLDSIATCFLWRLPPIRVLPLALAAHRRAHPRESGYFRWLPQTNIRSVLCVHSCSPVQLTQKQTTRRVVPRHERAISVHSTSSDSAGRRRSVSVVYGRGPVIPQERYTTSTAPSHNADQHRFIPFSVEDPDQTGIPIVDILNKTDGFARLRDRTEPFEMGKMTFTLRLLVSSFRLMIFLRLIIEPAGSSGPGTNPGTRPLLPRIGGKCVVLLHV